MTSFEYPAIGREGTTFRLLRLLKGDDNRIHCELFGSELPKDVGDYAALSYTWGSERKLCEIIINEMEMIVTKNAYLALRDLRYPDKDRILWIDALCIDQQNKEEQAKQVQQMGSIYSKAERVIIWLGEATYDTDYAMRYMKQLEENGRSLSDDPKSSEEQWANIWLLVIGPLRDHEKNF